MDKIQNTSRTRPGHTLDAASVILGISKDAIRKRINRGSIEAAKTDKGQWLVYLDNDKMDNRVDKEVDNVQDNRVDNVQGASSDIIEMMKENIAYLKQELANKQAMIESQQREKEQLIKQNENSQSIIFSMQQQQQILIEAPRKSWFDRFKKNGSNEEI